MAGYSKLFSSIVTSTVWGEGHTTRIVWITLLAICDAKGIVEGSIPGLAHQARVSLTEAREALKVLSSPDSFSRTPDNEGRRIEAIRGGWKILNYEQYRQKGQEKDGSRAEYHRNYYHHNRKMLKNVELNISTLNHTAPASASASAFPRESNNKESNVGTTTRTREALTAPPAPQAPSSTPRTPFDE